VTGRDATGPAPYEHRQSSVWIALLAGAAVGIPLIGALLGGQWIATAGLMAVAALLLALATAMSELRTVVTAEHVRASFRFGWPSKTIPVAAIVSHRPIRNGWWWGFGIRWVPGGWMFNVWGLDAVEIRCTGRWYPKSFRIGTDDPEGLDAAIAAAVAGR
jgi:hypothetical protein